MPKLQPTKEEQQNRLTRGILDKYQANHGYTDKDMAIKLGISPSLYRKRHADPSQLKLKEIRHIVKGMKPDDAVELIGAL